MSPEFSVIWNINIWGVALGIHIHAKVLINHVSKGIEKGKVGIGA
jgi:hypothetical protein